MKNLLKTTSSLYLILLSGTLLFTACKKQEIPGTDTTQSLQSSDTNAGINSVGTRSLTWWQLEQARKATAKYQDINNAIADGYVDINVVMPNMGYHYEKVSLVDSVFDVRHPELLVYNKKVDGSFELGAVEYAVPLDESVNAPAGFAGTQDVWDHNTDFGLWTLHAWVWKHNPDGIFSPTNSAVIVR